MVRIKHVAPHELPRAGGGGAQNIRAGADTLGGDLSRRKFARLARGVPVHHAPFVVAHHVARRAPQFVDIAGLPFQQRIERRLAHARADLAFGHDVRMKKRNAQPRAVGDAVRAQIRRLVPRLEFARVWSAAEFRISDGIKVRAFLQHASVLGLHGERRAGASQHIHEAALLDARLAPPDRPAMPAPHAEVELHLGVIERVERDVMRLPVLRRLLVDERVIELHSLVRDHLDVRVRSAESGALDPHRHMILAERLHLELLAHARVRVRGVGAQRAIFRNERVVHKAPRLAIHER